MIWKILPKKSEDLAEQLLINRGVKTDQEKEQFFNPKISDFEKNLQIPGIEKASKRIKGAIEKNEQIIVYGDFDVDGICASAILYKALTSLGAKVLPYIPHREKEGYGLSKLGLNFARDSGATVVITVDNGIVAIEQARFAKEIGLDLIITDHHLPLDQKPDAFAIVHSTKMCGAAVAWCLIKNMVSKKITEELLQFVAIATVCDLLPLLGLGRAFLVEGLKELHKTTNLGLLAIINENNLNLNELGSYEIGYIIGPRLNAMGRLEHAIDSLRLLCTKDPIKARTLANLLTETNERRKQLTDLAIEEAKVMIIEEKNIHVLSSANWSSGIVGLIASRICEITQKPAIAISRGENFSRGSARSVAGLNIVEVIRRCADLLVAVGGHRGAAGFTIETTKINEFHQRLDKLIDNQDFAKESEQILEIDAQIGAAELSIGLVKQLVRFEPFGVGNTRPVLATLGLQISDIRTVGSGKHLKFKADGLDAIGFGMGDLQGMLANGQIVDLAYTLEIDNYNGFEKIQLKIKDVKI